MSNLTVSDIPSDLFSIYLDAKSRHDDPSLSSLRPKIVTKYLLFLREKFQNDEDVKQIVINSSPATSAIEKLTDKLGEFIWDETESQFREALSIILEELDTQRNKPGSMYLIDHNTGRAIMPITKEMVYTPPDYIGEDGKTHHSKPILHPSISSSLGLVLHEKEKRDDIIRKAEKNGYNLTYEHLKDPEIILYRSNEILRAHGFDLDPFTDEFTNVEFEIGKEHISSIYQSPNHKFHRAASWAEILVKKIERLDNCLTKRCFLSSIKENTNSKHRWYNVTVQFPNHLFI